MSLKKKRTPEVSKRHCMVVFAPYPLGETRVQREAEALKKHGYSVDVICLRLPDDKAVDSYKGVMIYREKYRFLLKLFREGSLGEQFMKYINFFFASAIRLTKLHLKNPYNSIQVHNIPDFLVFCALIPKIQRIPIILDLHDLMPELFNGCFGKETSILARLIRLQERLACRFADHVITVSEHWRKALIQRGVPESKCSVVMNVADASIFNNSAQTFDKIERRDGFRLIYHGALLERYGLDIAIQAVSQVRHEIPGIHLSLIGYGEHLPCLIRLIDELGLSQHVSIENMHLAEELPDIIRTCHLGVVPYRNDVFTDGLLPTKLMEYAALGMPAIAARTTAIKEYFSNANVEFFEPGNVDDLARCILMLYRNPTKMAELARGSQRFIQRYNWAQICESYVNLVDRLGSRRSAANV